MADEAVAFRALENGTGVGQPQVAKAEGDAPSTDNGVMGFSYVDSSGNLVLPQLDASGNIKVVTGDAGGTCINGRGTAGGSLTAVDIVTLTLALTKTYRGLELSASSLGSSLWTIVAIDDVGGTPAETEIWRAVRGPGDYGIDIKFDCAEFSTAGGTGTQNLVLRALNTKNPLSDFHAYMGIKEF